MSYRSIKLLGVAASVGALLACSQQSATAETPMLHPVEKVCIDYQMTGQMMSGTTTRCHRDYGYEQYEIQNITVGVAGFTQTQSQHTITIGPDIYAVNTSTNTATKTTNPFYDAIVNSVQGSDPEAVLQSFLSVMGYTSTGSSKTIAGSQCTVYNSQQTGSACFTDDGLILEQNLMGMGGMIATSVDQASGGDNDNYTLYQNMTIAEGPDLSQGLSGLINQ